MPGGDRTGPDGAGPMSGRAMGYCAGYDAPGYAGCGFGGGRGMGRGAGFGRGRGGGRGWRNMFRAAGLPRWQRWAAPAVPRMTRDEEINLLKEESEALSRSLADIQERMKELEEKQ